MSPKHFLISSYSMLTSLDVLERVGFMALLITDMFKCCSQVLISLRKLKCVLFSFQLLSAGRISFQHGSSKCQWPSELFWPYQQCG